MAKNKQQMIFEVTGDVTGLRKALSDGTQAIDKFGSESGELFGGLTESIGGLTSKFAGFSTGLVGTAGALGLVVGGVFSLVSASNEYVKTYNEVAASSSLSVTQLQKLEKQFGSTGLSVEKFGDLNRDVLDHLGDAFRDGSGPAGDMKAYGINLQNFNKYLNQSDGGIQAVAEAFYEMRKAGKSTAEITNMMETLGSDGSKLIGVFNQYGSALEFNNALQSQHAVLTEESARKYQEFDTKVTQLSTSFQLWKANALTPTVEEINTLLDLMNKDWSGTKFAEFFKDGVKGFFFNGDNAISKGLRNMFDEGATDYETEASKRIKDMAAQLQADIKDATKTTSKGGFVNKDKEEAARKAAAAKAAAEAKAQAQKVAQAQIQWDTATAQSGISTGEIRIKEFNRQQDALVKKIQDTGKILGKSQADIDTAVSTANASRQRQLADIVNEMVGITDTNKELRDLSTNIAAVYNQLSQGQAQQLMQTQSTRLGIGAGNDESNPFDNSNVLDQKKKDLQEQQDLELTMNEQLSRKLGLSQEQYQKRKAAIQQEYNKKSLAIETDNTKAQMTMLSGAAGDLGTILAGAFGEGSKAAEAAFALQKGIQIAQIIMNIQTALSSALATPFPASIAAYAQVLSLGASIITTAKGTASGKAHNGIDEIPGSGDQTWILKGGERIVQPEANKKLTSYLDKQDSKSSSSDSGYVVNAPLVIQGGSTDDDAKFQSMLKKHANSVTQAVKSAQSRTT